MIGRSEGYLLRGWLRRDDFIGEDMNARLARGMAWSLVGVYIILVTAGLTLQVFSNTSFVNLGIPLLIPFILIIGVWPVIGALIISRHPRHPVGWLLCTGLFVVSLDLFATGYAYFDKYSSASLPGVGIALVWLTLSGLPFAITAFTLMILVFPDGRPLSPGWRKVIWTTIGALLVYLPLQALEPGPIIVLLDPSFTNPLGMDTSLWAFLRPLMWAAFSVLALCNLAADASLISRLHQTKGDEHQQVKWLVFPAFLFTLGIPLVSVRSGEAAGLILGIGIALHLIAAPGMVIATAIAIFKYRLYDIDLIINKTLVYGALSGTLALVYFMSVVLLTQIFQAGSQVAIVLSTLAIAALFSPLRRRIQNDIDKRFYRRKYDAQQTLAAFGATIRDEVELEQLSETLLGAVEETMQPAYVSVWLKEDKVGAHNLLDGATLRRDISGQGLEIGGME